MRALGIRNVHSGTIGSLTAARSWRVFPDCRALSTAAWKANAVRRGQEPVLHSLHLKYKQTNFCGSLKRPMRDFFGRKTAALSSHTIGKADKKKFNAVIPDALDIKQEYKIFQMSNKTKVIKQGSSALYFQYHNQTFPTVKNFNKGIYKCVLLDAGAVAPLARGADVMAPGVLKFADACPDFAADEVLGVEIEGQGIFAVGVAILSSREMKRAGEGPVINVLHLRGDALDEGLL